MAKVKKQAKKSQKRGAADQKRKIIVPKRVSNYFRPLNPSLLPDKSTQVITQKSNQSREFTIKMMPFMRIVRELLTKSCPEMRINQAAVKKIQESSQAFMIQLFQETKFCAKQNKRVMIMRRDMQLVRRIQGLKY